MLLLREHKWNIFPYSRKSLLCPEAYVHPTSFMEDLREFQDAAKNVIGRVAELIEIEMVK